MTRRPSIFAVLTLLVLPAWSWADDSQPSKPASQASSGQVFDDVRPSSRRRRDVLHRTAALLAPTTCASAGGRSWSTGSPDKTGEYQDLTHSSPFWDVDGMSSDGIRTFAITATGTDQETNKANAYYYQPGLSAKVDYDRFIHQLITIRSTTWATSTTLPLAADTPHLIIKQDLGADRTTRCGSRKSRLPSRRPSPTTCGSAWTCGEWRRTARGKSNAIGMCYHPDRPVRPPSRPTILAVTAFTGSRCHVLSMPQQIDWQTTEIKPVIEARLGDPRPSNTPGPCAALPPTTRDDPLLRPRPSR